MPVYDLTCENNHEQLDVLLKLGERPPCPICGKPTATLWTSSGNVIGDECDITVRHGICNEDGSPRRYTSKAEMARVAKEKGLTNVVTHVPDNKGTDKSKHTKRWI